MTERNISRRLPLPDEAVGFLDGGGEMGARMRAFDWRETPLGHPATWPQSLKTVVRILLTSRFAMWMAWGPDLTFFCNDAYLPTTGIKRDWVLGARSDQVWAEIWPDIGPRVDHVLVAGEATWDEALPLYLERSGFLEESYHTFSYSPLADDSGLTVGMLCVVAEVTERVIGERQLGTLRDLGARFAAASTRREVMRALEVCLADSPQDIPFALAYLTDRATEVAKLVAVHRLSVDEAAIPHEIDTADPSAALAIGRARAGDAVLIDLAANAVDRLPLTHWQLPPRRALVCPLAAAEGGAPVGYLVLGLNPHRAFDSGYRGFFDLLAGQVAAAIARTDEYERARDRAEALAEIDRAKTAFFSNVSHEFRTPLTLMLGPLEELLAKPQDQFRPANRSLVAVAHRNGQRLLRLVNALLDFARIEAGRVDATFRPVDLGALTTELASTFRSACERAGLALHIACETPAAETLVDPDMWEKIVFNLLSNAFKFTFTGGITVRLRATESAAVLEVADTGTGIPAAELPRLFERFHRVQGAAGRSFEGSGIGLALVHDLVRLHGGEVSVESREGVGSTFRVSLPLGREHLPEYRIVDAGEAPSVGGRASGFVAEALRWLPGDADDVAGETGIIKDAAGDDLAPPPRRHGHVLLADDNADLRDYVGRLLRNRGYTVEAVGDGDAALDAAQANRPDLLLTDVMMPKRDGFSLLAAIRADPRLSDLPVVMLSARAGEEAQVEGLDAGADDYLAKPFSARELLARVSANLDMARIRRQAAEAIRASEAKLRIEREFLASVLAKAPVGISIVDGEGRMSMLNERAVELLGHRFLPKDADGFSGYRAIHPDGSPYAIDEYPTVRAARGERVDGERMIYLRSGAGDPAGADAGERVVLEVDAVPIRDADGRSAGAVPVFVDAEARERAEEELRRRVDEAIAAGEAAREELHQLQKLETIGQLTGGVAHDFNNLLTPIVGALDLLRRRYSLDDRAVRMIEVAQQSAERARVLISRLLTFARRQHLEARPVNLGELVSGMSDLIERSLGVQIAVVYDIQADAASVMADPNQLELAILNLCVNARDAMPAGGQLSITVREQAAGGLAAPSAGYVELAVADTGVGMEPDTLKRAIEPFYTTKGVGKGTGLGLSMVHGLAAQSGGALQLDSAPGRGTTARILLPALTADTTAAPAAPAPRSAAPLAMEPLRILLVDDEELVRAGTAEMLEALGHSVVQAASGPAALKALKTMDCDLMVADYLMPAMTGVELIEHARALIPTLPVLLVTGYTGLHLKLDDRLTRLGKPFGEAELAAAVAGAMAGSQ